MTTIQGDAQVIEVQPGERLDRDFILRWRVDAADLVSSLVCTTIRMARGTFALTIVPPSTQTVGAKPRDVVLVIDRSGSMGGWKMVAARRAAARMIDTLTSRDRFCAVAFDNELDSLLPGGLVAATDHTDPARPPRSPSSRRGAAPRLRAAGPGARDAARYDEESAADPDYRWTGRQRGRRAAPDRAGPGNTTVFTLGIDQAVNAAFLAASPQPEVACASSSSPRPASTR